MVLFIVLGVAIRTNPIKNYKPFRCFNFILEGVDSRRFWGNRLIISVVKSGHICVMNSVS